MQREVRLNEAVDEFLGWEKNKGMSWATIATDKTTLGRFRKDVGNIQLRSITQKHIDDWFYGPQGLMSEHRTDQHGRTINNGISPSTHNSYLARLRVFFQWCQRRGYVKADPTQSLQRMKVHLRKRIQPPPITLLRMLESVDSPRDRAYLATALNTALRASEINRITVGDVNLDEGYIDVLITKTKEEDQQPITSDLDTELRRWLSIYTSSVDRPLLDTDYLFPAQLPRPWSHWETTDDGERRVIHAAAGWDPQRRMRRSEHIVKNALAKMGMESRYEGTHTVRRAVARAFFDSQCSEVGYDAALRTTSALLHHRTSAITERYLGLTAERERRDKMLRGRPFLSAMVAPQDNVVPLRRVK